MAITDVADQYFTYESRLTSFQTAQQLSKRRTSSANSKVPKSMKWPHKFLSAQELAKAGFFYYPLQVNPDNVACFLCHKSMDGWEEDDDPLAEHLKHSPDCGWAIVATIEKQDIELSQEYPSTVRMNDARKATFADKWPHEGKKGWKCKVKQMVEAGWKYTPTPEYDDMATCAYCSLALDGWEPGDKPMDEHYSRSPDCAFFTLINDHKQTPKRTKSKRDRASKASRLSTQSTFTVAFEGQSMVDSPAEEDDSILTTATNATQTCKKMGKGKKVTIANGKKTRAKKGEPVEVESAPEPEDADFEVKVDSALKPNRGRKRKSEQDHESTLAKVEIDAPPPPKRRVTRTRGSIAINDSMIMDDVPTEIVKPRVKKGRPSTKSARKASTASVVPLHTTVPNDDEIDKALEADLERQLIDQKDNPATRPKRNARASTVVKAGHAIFGTDQMQVDEAAIEAELDAMETETKPLPKAKGAKGKQARKPSAKQQAAAGKAVEAAEAEAEAQRLAEEEASQQIASELEQSISMHLSSPIVQPKRQRATSRQPSRRLPGRATRASRASVVSVSDRNVEMAGASPDVENNRKEDSGNETDVSMASQSTVVRGGSTRRGSTLKKGRGEKKAISRNIEEIVHKDPTVEVVEEAPLSRKRKNVAPVEDVSMVEENFYTPAPKVAETLEAPKEEAELPVSKAKARGRPAKATTRPQIQQTLTAMVEYMEQDLEPGQSSSKQNRSKSPLIVRSPTPPSKEATPSQSPQSSEAENHPPSSKPSASAKKTATPHTTTTRNPLASTPISPSKRNIIAGLQSTQPWTAIDLDTIFMKSPTGDENVIGAFGGAMQKIKNGGLTSLEKKMSVEEWIIYNAGLAEEKLRSECESMVGVFENEGGRAMRSLEGVECIE